MRGTMRLFFSTRSLFASALLIGALGMLAGASGCGGVYYTVSVNAAQAKLEQARQMGAETQSPYEYYFAREHLRQAQVEASEASYSDAAGYAETAELYAQKAIDFIQTAKKSGDTK
jgi:hypothetical protein